jgi:hypothetical protein
MQETRWRFLQGLGGTLAVADSHESCLDMVMTVPEPTSTFICAGGRTTAATLPKRTLRAKVS